MINDHPHVFEDTVAGHMQRHQPPITMLTVSDVERLAKAGVKVDLEQIKDRIVPDPVAEHVVFDQIDRHNYLRDFLKRWDRAQPTDDPNSVGTLRDRAAGLMHSFEYVSIYRRDRTFHVFVIMRGGKVAHLTDPAEAFPSEALIAKCFLLQKEGAGDAT